MTISSHSFLRRHLVFFLGFFGCLLVSAMGAEVEVESETISELAGTLSGIDRVFLVFCACLVFMMQSGFCLLELGFSQAKNSINVIMKNLLDFSLASVAFLVGVVFMFGNSVSGWIGLGGWDHLFTQPANGDFWVFWLFQAMFVGTASTIASGAMAERTRFVGYLIYTVVLSGLIYPVLGHWAWGSHGGAFGMAGNKGWLEGMGFLDFAGGTVVHGVGGACALAGILVVGPRAGRFGPDGLPRLMVGHNLPMAALGALLLWFGWYGFNGGSLKHAGPALGGILVNTTLAAAFGAITAMLPRWVMDGRPDAAVTINGALAGLVSITAGANVVSPFSALAIGMIGGLLATFGEVALIKCRIDDVVGAVPVHLFAGVWGTIAVSLFHMGGFDSQLFFVQVLGTGSICFAAFAAAFIAFKTIDLLIGLRASDEDQEDGLDFSEHAANAYPDFVTTDQV